MASITHFVSRMITILLLALFPLYSNYTLPEQKGCREYQRFSMSKIRYEKLHDYIAHKLANPEPEHVHEHVRLIHEPTEKNICSGTWQECAQKLQTTLLPYDAEDLIVAEISFFENTCYQEFQS